MNVFYQIKRTWLVGAVLLSVMLSYSSLGAKEPTTLSEKIDKNFTPFVKTLSAILFLDPFEAIGLHDGYVRDEKGNIVMKDGQPLKVNVPLVVVWLVMGAIYFTLRMRFVNLRGFIHAIQLVRGKFRRKDDKGEISSFQALATALSATVGMGNIAGVAVAISVGGEGASFWMIVSAFLGMSSKFVECSLGVKYRQIDKTGMVHGGPMYYLKEGLKQKGLPRLGSFLAISFAVMCVGGSLGGGNMLQANQAFLLLSEQLPSLKSYGFWFGLVFASLVGIVTIGGVKSIARVTDKLVPFMCAFYLMAGFIVIFVHLPDVPAMFWRIVSNAFCPSAMYGGFLGVLIQGFRRASFSNEAGIGSSAIAHAPARTNEPTSEGLVAMLEPVVDTMIVCTMTALVIGITGVHLREPALHGTALTAAAFGSVVGWFPLMLTVAVLLFAFSTTLSWGYYGEMAWRFLFGDSPIAVVSFKVLYMTFVVIGASVSMAQVIEFSDMMILGMAFPNITGLLVLSSDVRNDMKAYFQKFVSKA